MARDDLSSDFREIMSDATTCSCNTNSIGKCSLESCGMFHEPFFLHPPMTRPRDGIYINPMSQFLSESPQQKQKDNSFYLHSPHELVYTRITRLFCDNVVGKTRRNGIERKDETLTVKVDVHINNNNNNNNNGGSIKSEIINKEAAVDHAYEQIYIKPEELLDSNSKKHSDDSSESCRSRKNARRFSRSSSGSESSSQMSSEIHYSSTVSTLSLSRNSSSECIQSKPPELPERKIPTPVTIGPETNLKIPIIIPCVANPPPPPPLPPPPAPAPAQVVDETPPPPPPVIPKIIEAGKNESGLSSSSTAINKHDSEEQQQQQQQQQQQVVESCISTSGDNSKTSQVSHLVNKHMVLPFIPPKFTNAADSNVLLKPSEYLRSICKASGKNTLSKARSVDNLDFRGTASSREIVVGEAKEADECQVTKVGAVPPGPPPPPLPPQNHHQPILPARSVNVVPTTATVETPRTPQPLATISIQDLTSVQLRRTNVKMHAAKTFSAPPPARSVSMTNVSEPFFVQKTDLIAELKMTRDIPGIKKFKVEMAKVEKTQEKNFMSEISKAFSVSNFVDQIPEKDSSGNVIPIWKRQMLARKAAERAKKELEEQIARENEEKRQKAIPPWKRQLLAKKDSLDPEKKVTPLVVAPAPVKIIEKNDVTPASVVDYPGENRANDDDNDDNKNSSNNNHNHNNNNNEDDDDDDDGIAIIPWRAQLRKTNSKLNILD